MYNITQKCATSYRISTLPMIISSEKASTQMLPWLVQSINPETQPVLPNCITGRPDNRLNIYNLL